ncbi:NAD(P)-binding protein [Violaceomyces palustris]|uniref:NAD(P)-binding protein n=1 Tax=Violaceomyces palustris TaxID=1673888 RepID=A0ACD0NMW2_9BASI|nr:NAD(P)-binding protein [Violaceomyces palustris]
MSFSSFARSLPPSLGLLGRTALVTGSSSGIGRQTALHLARAGASVVCSDLRPDPLPDQVSSKKAGISDSRHIPTHELISKLGGVAVFQTTDVSSEAAFKKAVEVAVELGKGRLDILVNNAGIVSFSGGVEGESLDTFDRMISINTKGVYIGTQLAIRQMLKQSPKAMPADVEEDLDSIDPSDPTGSPARRPSFEDEVGPPPTVGRKDEQDKGGRGSRGTIIQIGSIHGLIGGPGEPAYAAAKGAVVNFTRQVATDYAPKRINVNCICPGYLDTAMTLNVPPELAAQRPTYWPHRGTARDVAKAVVFMARDAPWMTGTVMALDGGTTAR